MLTHFEDSMAREILDKSSDPNAAMFAILLRRLFPKIRMERGDLIKQCIGVSNDITELMEQLEAEAYQEPAGENPNA